MFGRTLDAHLEIINGSTDLILFKKMVFSGKVCVCASIVANLFVMIVKQTKT